MDECILYLIGGDENERATVVCRTGDGLCHLSFRYRDGVLEESATDYFEAFRLVRLRLEEENLIPFCYGASLNVHPSGMCRDMGAGLKAYRMSMGRRVDRNDLVDIFSEGPDVMPATVAMQKSYFEEWLRSEKC
ncbi:hypothetical protein GCM10023212_14840 [Luteolibacter yonseiensis]|uniref:hypothetical protein n=1 Tax=Luteolibacter yonseiensis TaxID=1144680 RepID=UPI0031ECFF40